MEEKLYFKPASYGKGKKKKQAEQKGKPENKKNHKSLKLVIVLLVLAIIVAVIIWLLHGKTTTTGQYPANVKNKAVNCESGTLTYPKITSVTSDKRNIKINLIFNEKDELKSISLTYALFYDSEEAVKRAEAFSHAEFNLGLNEQGYNASAFENKFARLSDQLIISLFGDASTVNEYNASYFMISDTESTSSLPKTIKEYTDRYQKQGFTCNTSQE